MEYATRQGPQPTPQHPQVLKLTLAIRNKLAFEPSGPNNVSDTHPTSTAFQHNPPKEEPIMYSPVNTTVSVK